MRKVFLQTIPIWIFYLSTSGFVFLSAQNKDAGAKQEPVSYEELLKGAQSSEGLMTIHRVGDKWYWEVAETLLGRELMAVTRYAQTSAGGGFYGGEEVNRQVIRWDKVENKLLLKAVSYVAVSADSTEPIFQAVRNSAAEPIIAAFDIKAKNGQTSYVIEVGEYFKGDNQVFSLDPGTKQFYKLNQFQADRSYVESIKTYPINTEIRSVKTFNITPPSLTPPPVPAPGRMLPDGAATGFVTMTFNTSIIALPEVPTRKRYFDARVGYFSTKYTYYGEDSYRAYDEVFVARWRLEPKNEEEARRQQQGELVEPKKPIVFYIDPATPEKWKPYLKQGVDDWQVAFEQAGWKNAIMGEYWDENDSTKSLEDARYSVIRYFASDIQNAYGPNVHDPRTGEILESHIGWYHNVMLLLRNWYLTQTSAVDSRAQKLVFDDELMGQLIRFVSSHEVGHTLGLRHNMGASSATPVEKLRDNAFLTENGHTSSIMDYARFNYVAQPEDNISPENLFPRIGDYDKWAIEWGYRYFPDAVDAEDEKKSLHQITKEKVKNPRLAFGTEISPSDPRYQTEDLGDNAMIASEYGIKNLKRILPQLPEWTRSEGEHYGSLAELYDNIVGQFRRYMGHVSKYVGGIYDTPKTQDMEGDVYAVVPKSLQKDALAFLNKHLFETPTWLFDPNILNKIRQAQSLEAIKNMQELFVGSLFSEDRMMRMMDAHAANSENYGIDELMGDLRNGIWAELKSKKEIDPYRRNLQKVFTDKMIALLKPNDKASVLFLPPGAAYERYAVRVDFSKTDLPSVAAAHLEELLKEIKSAVSSTKDKLTVYHLKDMALRIENALNPGDKK